MDIAISTAVTVDQYVHYREHGYLIVRGLLAAGEVGELLEHVDELTAADPDLLRVHMLHRRLEIHERYLLHPRVVDVVAGLVGPDVLALQTMLFVKGPGSPGQGYHQDSFHIITEPDTLIGAWIALDEADTENGCVWITAGSQNEPVYPDADELRGHGGDRRLADIVAVSGADDPDESRNELTPVAAKYAGPRGAGRARSGRRRVLRRPRPAPLAREPQRHPLAARLRGPLLQRALARAVGRRAAMWSARWPTAATSSRAGRRTCRSRGRGSA